MARIDIPRIPDLIDEKFDLGVNQCERVVIVIFE